MATTVQDDRATAPERGPPPVAAGRAHAAETIRLYARDWAAFCRWCRKQNVSALPAAPDTVAAYLAAGAATVGPGALRRRLAAITDQHRQAGHPSPADGLEVKTMLRDLRLPSERRRLPRPPPDQLARMAAACRGDLAGLRDRALLLLAAAAELGRADLVGLDFEHVRLTPAGLDLAVMPRDGSGQARTLFLPRKTSPAGCPVRSLEDWLQVTETRFGPVFRKIDRWSNVEHRRLGTDAVRRILARRALPRRRRAAGALS